MKKNKILFAALISVSITIIYSLFNYYSEQSFSGEELVLGLRTGMSPSVVEKTLKAELKDSDEIKYILKDNYMEPENFFILTFGNHTENIGDKKIPPSLRKNFKELHAVSVFMNQKVLISLTFFEEELYYVNIDFDTFYGDTFQITSKAINEQSRDKYNSKLSLSDTVSGAYNIEWKKNNVNGTIWINPNSKSMNATFYNNSFVLDDDSIKDLDKTNTL
jgi:hypothetical protein